MERRDEIHLREYESCQSHINALATEYWIGVGVFMGINAVLLGGLLYSVLQRINIQVLFKDTLSGNEFIQVIAVGGLIFFLSLAMIFILKCLSGWLGRVNSSIRATYERMREIETYLEMWRGWLIHGLDQMGVVNGAFNFQGIPDDIKDMLLRYHSLEEWQELRGSKWYVRPIGARNVRRIFCILITLWGVFALVALGAIGWALIAYL